MNMAELNKEPALTDAELRAVRAMVVFNSTLDPNDYGGSYTDKIAELASACRAALPAPTPEAEPEVVAEPWREYWHIRRGQKFWNEGEWGRSDEATVYSKADADLIVDGLRAREKAAKRPRIEVVRHPDRLNWCVQCGNMHWSVGGEKWCIAPWSTTSSEFVARALAAKLEAEQNYPPEVTK